MFGVLLSNELSKLSQELPQPIGGKIQRKPAPITPPGGYPPAPVTPSNPYAPIPMQAQSNFNPGYNKMASQESTMNMFGVLVNMELQKLAQEAPGSVDTDSLKNNLNDVMNKAKGKKPAKKPAWNLNPITDKM